MLCKDKICNDDLIDEENSVNLAKLGSGPELSPTVTVGDKTKLEAKYYTESMTG